jgi:hypothetical protein
VKFVSLGLPFRPDFRAIDFFPAASEIPAMPVTAINRSLRHPFIKRVLLALCFTLAFAALATRAADTAGWVPLFDGKSLDGWVQKGGVAKYRVEDGQIIGTPITNTPNSFLCTKRDYTNFVLEVEFKVAEGLNSGVQIRSHAYPDARVIQANGKAVKVPAGRVHGLQAEIDPSSRAWTAGLYGESRGGWYRDLKDNEPARKAFKAGEWNRLRIECRGESIKTWLNEVAAADLNDDLDRSGFIALQVHGVKKDTEGLEIRFRNIRIKEL